MQTLFSISDEFSLGDNLRLWLVDLVQFDCLHRAPHFLAKFGVAVLKAEERSISAWGDGSLKPHHKADFFFRLDRFADQHFFLAHLVTGRPHKFDRLGPISRTVVPKNPSLKEGTSTENLCVIRNGFLYKTARKERTLRLFRFWVSK